jgi:hypothetical protein
MATLDYRVLEDGFVLHYGSETSSIDARTLTQSLTHFVNALQVINDRIEPGSEMRIYVDALGPGSFRIKLSKRQKKLLSQVWGKAEFIILTVLAGVILMKIEGDEATNITINIEGDVVIVQQGDNQVKLPANLKEAIEKLVADDKLDTEISQAFEVLNNDHEVKSLGIARTLEDEVPLLSLDGHDIAILSQKRNVEDHTERWTDSQEELRILKAVFERSKRKWQFIRGNTKISASITDKTFFDRLARREIVIGDGDTLVVSLRTYQVWNDLVGAWIDDSYEIMAVFDHRRRAVQLTFDQSD